MGFDQSGPLIEGSMPLDPPSTDRECDGCGDWHPDWFFNDEATELCDHCLDDWEGG
jgi:hypothetical protein